MTPLRRNRDFQLLWSGQVVSALGTRISSVALPLLVLELTDSPGRAGLVRFAGQIPLLLFMLPAGAVLDRLNRKRVMLACEAIRGLALGSVAVMLWLGWLTYAQLVVVATITGTGFAFFEVAQRSALRQLVPAPQLPAAVSQNAAREYTGLIAGQALGGLLFGLGRVLPFLADAVSYLASLTTLLLIRGRFQEERGPAMRRRVLAEIAEGLAWLWRRPFLRTTAMLATGSDLVVNALYLAVIVIAREQGASPGLIGTMLAFMGASGLVGSLFATRLARLLSVRAVGVLTMAVPALVMPLLALVPNPPAIGLLYGAMFALHPTWGAAIGARQMAMVPDRLQGRVQSAILVTQLGAVPLGSLVVGGLLQWVGGTWSIAVLAAVMVAVALGAVLSGSMRRRPRLEATPAAG